MVILVDTDSEICHEGHSWWQHYEAFQVMPNSDPE